MNVSIAEDMPGPANSWVQFKSFQYDGTDDAATRLISPRKEFLNPILAGFYPDPSLCRVGDDYYLVNSSFAYFPGIPIFHSRDLVTWTQIGFVMDRPSQFSTLREGDVSRGIYAPTIRYHDGKFYVICTLVNGGGNFYVTAKDPAGPWSEPFWLKQVEGIDPSFFFDNDGRAYVLNCAPPPDNQPLYSGHRTIRIQEFDLNSGQMTGTQKILIDGGTDISKKPVWIEGPHLFKHNRRYFLIAAEGGTGETHSVVVFRADSVWGPYRPYEDGPILTQRQLPPDRPEPITCAGHADFVELPNGQWWAVFLACRPYEQNWYNTGRETFLLPVHWENDWPVILKDEQIIPRIAARPDLPPEPESKSPLHGSFSWTDRFDQSQLNLRWQFLRPPALEWFSLMDTPGSLLIAPQSVALSDYGNPSLIACRQQHAKFSASTTVIVNPTTTPCEAGLVAFQNETHYLFLGIRMNGTGADEAFVEQLDAHAARGKPAPAARTLSRVPLPQRAARIILKIASTGRFYSAYCGVNDGSLKSLCENVDGSFLSTNVAGGFQGVMLGMFARK